MSCDLSLPSHLTMRQRQLIGLMCEGITDSEIARRMHLSDRQVRREVSTLLTEFKCRNRFQLGVATGIALATGQEQLRCTTCSTQAKTSAA